MLTPEFVDFSTQEYDRRTSMLRTLMKAEGLDAVLVTTEANHRFITGHVSHRWLHRYTAIFALVPLNGAPVLVVPPLEAGMCRHDSWVEDIRVYPSTRLEAGVATLTEVIREKGLDRGRIGAELGGVLYMRMPTEDFARLRRNLPDAVFVDAAPVLWKARFRKSPAELDRIREAVSITDRAYGALFSSVAPGTTEREIHRLLAMEQLRMGADTPGSITVASHDPAALQPHDHSHRRPTDRPLAPGDLVIIDAGCVVRGYWSDYTRMFAMKRTPETCRDAYRAIHRSMTAAIDAAKPGVPIADMVRAASASLGASGYAEQARRMSNIGHASGLDIIEPPFIALEDPTILEEGMVLTVEPAMVTETGFYMIEEDVVITAAGREVLSAPAPEELPVI